MAAIQTKEAEANVADAKAAYEAAKATQIARLSGAAGAGSKRKRW